MHCIMNIIMALSLVLIAVFCACLLHAVLNIAATLRLTLPQFLELADEIVDLCERLASNSSFNSMMVYASSDHSSTTPPYRATLMDLLERHRNASPHSSASMPDSPLSEVEIFHMDGIHNNTPVSVSEHSYPSPVISEASETGTDRSLGLRRRRSSYPMDRERRRPQGLDRFKRPQLINIGN